MKFLIITTEPINTIKKFQIVFFIIAVDLIDIRKNKIILFSIIAHYSL